MKEWMDGWMNEWMNEWMNIKVYSVQWALLLKYKIMDSG